MHDTGARRNMFQLASAGRIAFSADDDTILFPSYMGPNRRPGCRAAEYVDEPRTYIAHSSLNSALATMKELPGSWIDDHIDLFRTGATYACGDNELLPIDVTIPGMIGDCGTGHASRLLHLQGPSWDAMVATPDQYMVTTSSRWCTRLTQGTILARGPFFMSTFYGIDNRNMRPPFLPNFRIQDGLFGVMRHLINPDTYVAYLPGALLHVPARRRRFVRDERLMPPPWRLAHFLRILVTTEFGRKRCTSPEEWCRELGTWLCHLSKHEGGLLNRVLAACFAQRVYGVIAHLKSQCLEPSSTPQFNRDVVTIIKRMTALLGDPDRYIPVEALQIDKRRPLLFLADYIGSFGKLLVSWPKLWNIAASENCGSH
jgi:hypothetical protein